MDTTENTYLKKENKITFKSIAIFSICLYIVFATVFESTAIGNTFLSTYALYFCLCCCALYIIVDKRITVNWVFVCFAVLGVILLISIFYSPTSWEYMKSIIYRYFTSIILVVLACGSMRTKKDGDLIFNSFIIGGLCLSLYIYYYYGFDYLFHFGNRLGSNDFGNINIVGMKATLAVLLSFYKLLTSQKNKFLWIIPIVICLPVIMFTGSRKAFLSVILCVIIFVLTYSNGKSIVSRIMWALLIIFGIIALVEYIPAFAPIKERLDDLFNIFISEEENTISDGKRIDFIKTGFESFLNRPLFGNGFCYSQYLFGTYSHNNYIELLMNNGIIGFIAYYAVFFKMFIETKKIKKDVKTYSLCIMLLLLLLFKDIGVVSYYDRLFLLLIGILSVYIDICRKDLNSRNITETH